MVSLAARSRQGKGEDEVNTRRGESLLASLCRRRSESSPLPETGTCLCTRLQSIGTGLEGLDQLETLLLCEIGNHMFFDGKNLPVTLPKPPLPDWSEVC